MNTASKSVYGDSRGGAGSECRVRPGKTQPVAVAVERKAPTKYRVQVELGVDVYNVTIAVFADGKHPVRCRTVGGYSTRGPRRALIEQAAREAVLA